MWLVTAFVLAFLAWAWFFEIDEVSNGSGKVIPSSREQRIQSLEGGILSELLVHEGDIVEKGQVLAAGTYAWRVQRGGNCGPIPCGFGRQRALACRGRGPRQPAVPSGAG